MCVDRQEIIQTSENEVRGITGKKLNMEGKEVRDVHLPDPIFDIQERATHTINTFTRKMETNYYKKKTNGR